MSVLEKDLTIVQGSTFQHTLRWEAPPIVYKPITQITKTAPAVVTAVAHGVPDGWRVAILSVGGMSQINASANPPKAKDFKKATVLTVDTLELNEVNAADYSSYTSGGYVMYYSPVVLSGFTARMTIKDKIGGAELLSLTTENGRIVLDIAGKKIDLIIPAGVTSTLTKKGVYDLEMVSGTSVVTPLMRGNVTLTKEVTTG